MSPSSGDVKGTNHPDKKPMSFKTNSSSRVLSLYLGVAATVFLCAINSANAGEYPRKPGEAYLLFQLSIKYYRFFPTPCKHTRTNSVIPLVRIIFAEPETVTDGNTFLHARLWSKLLCRVRSAPT